MESTQPEMNSTQIHKIKLTAMGLTDEDVVRHLIPLLNSMPSLRKLDLSDNVITEVGLKALLEGLNHQELTHINLSGNLMRCHSVRDWNKNYHRPLLTALSKRLRRLKRVDLTANYIHSHSKNLVMIDNSAAGGVREISRQQYKAVFSEILHATRLSLKGFLACSNEELEEQCCAQVKLYKKLAELKVILGKARVADVFLFFKTVIPKLYLDRHLCAELDIPFYQQDAYQQKIIIKELVRRHDCASLSDQLDSHPVFHSQHVSTQIPTQSLIFPVNLSLGTSYVYLLASKNQEHAMLAFECVTPQGQRVFEIAHLTVRGGNVAIEYFERELILFKNKLNKKYQVSCFETTYSNCKSLWEAIDHEVKNGLSQEYTTFVMSDDKLNCLTWAVRKIEKYLGLNLEDYTSFGHIPSFTVGNIQKIDRYSSPHKSSSCPNFK